MRHDLRVPSLRFVTAALVALSSSSCGVAPEGESVARSTSTILKGKASPADAAVVQVVISAENAEGFCSGVVVSPHVVLTAAHCVDESTIGKRHALEIFAGSDSNAPGQSDDPNNWFGILRIVTAPGYAKNTDQNVAAIVVDKPLTATPIPIRRAALPDGLVGEQVRVVGFGYTDAAAARDGETGPGGGPPPASKGTLGVRASAAATVTMVRDDELVTSEAFCHGDNGGPVLLAANGLEEVIAVHAYNDAECTGRTTHARIDTLSASFVDPIVREVDPGFLEDAATPPPPDAPAENAVPVEPAAPPPPSSVATTTSSCAAAGAVGPGGSSHGASFASFASLAVAAALSRRRRR